MVKYDELFQEWRTLKALENAGVDNWDGYDYAMMELHEGDDE